MLEGGKQSLIRQPLVGRRLGDAKINHLGHRHAIIVGHQDVRGFNVAMNDALLMRVLNGLGDVDEQAEPLLGGQIILVAVLGDLDPMYQLHDKVRTARLGRASLEDFGNVRMIH